MRTKAEVKGYDWVKKKNRIFIQVLYFSSVWFTLDALLVNSGQPSKLQVMLLKVQKQQAALKVFCIKGLICGLFRFTF